MKRWLFPTLPLFTLVGMVIVEFPWHVFCVVVGLGVPFGLLLYLSYRREKRKEERIRLQGRLVGWDWVKGQLDLKRGYVLVTDLDKKTRGIGKAWYYPGAIAAIPEDRFFERAEAPHLVEAMTSPTGAALFIQWRSLNQKELRDCDSRVVYFF